MGRTLAANRGLAGSACGKRRRVRPLNSVVSRHSSTVVTFVRAHIRAVKRLFIAMLLVPIVAFIANGVSPALLPQSVGWMLLLGSWPWSLPFMRVPFVGLIAVIIGFALNATIVVVACWCAWSWWLNTLRVRNDG